MVFSMKREFEIVITVSVAVWVAAYAAIAIGYVAHYDLGFPFEEIRSGAVLIAVVMATLIAIDFFGKKLRGAK
jgi:hypothetical protein